MKTSFKRAAAWLLTVLMILSCVPALATESVTEMMEGSISLFDAVSTYDVDGGVSTLAIGKTETLDLEVGKSYTITSDTSGNPAASGTYSSHIESWESSNTGVATVTGITNSDNQYKQTQATIKGVSVGTATITHTYYTADYSEFIGAYYNWQTQTETVTVNVSNTPNYTVTFDIGTEAESAGVEKPASVMVQSGKTLTGLPAPEWKDQDGQYVKIFAGWYSDESLTAEFTSSTPVESNMTLYAYWVDPDVDEMYYVNFLSQDGQTVTVHLTLAVRKGQTVNPASGPVKSDCVFKGWSTEKQEEKPVSELNAFDFTAPVSDSGALAGNTLNLYAWYAPAVKVSFISNGGSAVPTQFLAAGETATEVAPTRTGYTFVGWYTDEELTQAYDFSKPVNADTTLYAKWKAEMVKVTLVYMYENADDKEYSAAGASQVVYAPAGSYVSIEKNPVTNKNATHNVGYSDALNGALTGYANTSATNNTTATIPDVRETYYQYNSATNGRYVNPDGTTVVLLYYNRARITLTFVYGLSSNGYINDINKKISSDDRAKYNVKYTETKKTSGRNTYDNFTYQFTAKYGQSITAVWPQVGWVTSSGTGDNTFYGWQKPGSNSNIQVTNMYTLESDLFNGSNGLSISDGKLVGAGELTSTKTNVYKDWAIYARTTLPGEKADFTYDGTNYTIYKEACQLVMVGQALGYKMLDGCTGTDLKLTSSYRSGMTANSKLTVVNSGYGSSLYDKYTTLFKDAGIAAGDFCQILLYKRGNLTLSVWTNADNYTDDPQTATHLYGDWIYNDDTDLLKTLEQDMEKTGYIFAGWYTDSEFTPGTEYKPDEKSRITANLNLYAKWEPDQFKAKYYLYMDDAEPYATQGFAEGGKIEDKIVPVAVQDQFLGWYWYQNGTLVPFDFTSTVGAAHVDNNGVLKLYAKWEGVTGKVSYLPGKGGDNSTQEVVDESDYVINSAAVQLPVHTKVWTDGSVPSDKGLTFVGWKAPNGRIYQPGRYVLVTRQLMQFEAQWSNDAVTLIYDANNGEGDNVTERWPRGSEVDIWDNMDNTIPHFTRDGYKLLGWDENMDATVPTYKLGEGTITLTANTTTLYAIWKKSTTSASIQKNVSGNFGDVQRGFTFKVKVVDENGASVDVAGMPYDGTDGYYRFTLKHGETKQLNNLPIGNKLYFHEENAGNYTQTVNQGDTSITTNGNGDYVVTISEGMAPIMFNNKYDVTPDTGVVLDSLPYIVILVIVLVGVVLMVRRRRREDD